MAGKVVQFHSLQQRAMEKMLEFLRSKSNGAATIQEVRWIARGMSMAGMGDAIVDWLEQAGAVRYEREVGAVYLLPVATQVGSGAGVPRVGGTD